MRLKPVLRRIPTRNITHQVQEQLRELVLSGVFRPGERLSSERDLIAALGVSRTTIREGLRGLEALGLVVIRHGSGVYIAETPPKRHEDAARIPTLPLRRETAQELLEVRLIAEPEISALAAVRATVPDLDRLKHDVEQFRAEIGSTTRPPTDLRFHVDLCKAVHNKPLLVVVQWVVEFYAKSGQLPKMKDVEDHEHIYKAVRKRSPEAARAAMTDHLQWVKQSLYASEELGYE